MTPAAFQDFKPWAVVTLLSLPPSEKGEFLDLVLYKAAVEARKEVKGLETMEEQLAVFDDLSEADQIALLRETLDSRDQMPAMFEDLIQAYLAQDLDALMERSEALSPGRGPKALGPVPGGRGGLPEPAHGGARAAALGSGGLVHRGRGPAPSRGGGLAAPARAKGV